VDTGCNAGFGKFADGKEDIGAGVVGKIEESADSRAKGKALLLLFNKCNILVSDGAVFCTEGIVRWERCVSFGEFGVGVITLKRVKDITVLVQGIAGVMMLVNTHL
jgi:hypothetical protein